MTQNDDRYLWRGELLRIQIQRHPKYLEWHASLGAFTRQVLAMVLEDNITPEIIEYARKAPDEEWEAHDFLQAIGWGNPDPDLRLSLTEIVLDLTYHNLDEFGEELEP